MNASSPRPAIRGKVLPLVVKAGLLALVAAVAAYAIATMVGQGQWIGVVLVCAALTAVLAVYAQRRSVPLKYLLPGMLLLLAFQIWPVGYTVATAFTNFGDGHRISKEESIAAVVANSVEEVAGSQRYRLAVAVPSGASPEGGRVVYLLSRPGQNEAQAGDMTGLHPLAGDSFTLDETGRVSRAEGYRILTAAQVNQRSAELSEFAVPIGDGAGIKKVGLSEAFSGKASITYDASADRLVDARTGTTYAPKNARWEAIDGTGRTLPQGWKETVGLKNFQDVLMNSKLRNAFTSIFAWNSVFAAVSVLSTFALGLLLALVFNDPRLKGRRIYRSILVLPYAMPGFITALVWASMYNKDFGLINNVTHLQFDWLGDPILAKVAVLLANLWLGFPYMFLVCTGALQAIPDELKESARIDGASPWQVLRLVVVPLLMVSVAPLLLASFSFNFNNFGLIYLLTGGGPFSTDDPNRGGTDLLITYAFRLAFGGSGQMLGLASAISIFIFVIVALLSYGGFRRTKALEEVN
jgi:arabinogalactan oligomer/maltooligosaccharide transport system permease protein